MHSLGQLYWADFNSGEYFLIPKVLREANYIPYYLSVKQALFLNKFRAARETLRLLQNSKCIDSSYSFVYISQKLKKSTPGYRMYHLDALVDSICSNNFGFSYTPQDWRGDYLVVSKRLRLNAAFCLQQIAGEELHRVLSLYDK